MTEELQVRVREHWTGTIHLMRTVEDDLPGTECGVQAYGPDSFYRIEAVGMGRVTCGACKRSERFKAWHQRIWVPKSVEEGPVDSGVAWPTTEEMGTNLTILQATIVEAKYDLGLNAECGSPIYARWEGGHSVEVGFWDDYEDFTGISLDLPGVEAMITKLLGIRALLQSVQ